MKKNFILYTNRLLTLALMMAATAVSAQINIPGTTPVTENFDAMAASATAALPTGWKISAAGAASPTWPAAGNFSAVNQQASSGTPATGGRYNWGTSATERALGIMTSGSYASPNSIMAFFRNTNAASISQLAISYDLERYRINTAAASVQFYYSTDGATWTAVAAGDIAAATIGTGANAYGFGPQATFSVSSFNITGLNIANGSDIYLRWNLNTTGGNSQGIAIDNFSLTATFTVSPAIAVSTTSLSGFSYLLGSGPSGQQSFTCSGSSLSSNITLSAPADYEISTTSGSGFGPSVTLVPVSGSVAATTIYVRLIAGLAGGSYNGELITASSTGSTSRTVTCNGDVTTGGIFINEIMVNPSGGNDGTNMPNTSEWIEFYNSSTAAIDISCWVFTDGDFSVTFPSGTSVAAGSYFTVASAAGTGLSPNLDWALCGCTTGGLTTEVGVFTNGAEQVVLFNAAGTVVDAVIWGGGQSLPTSVLSAAGGGCAAQTLSLPASGATYESIGSVTDGVANERDYDASSTWQQTASPTFASTNGVNPMPIELLSFSAEPAGKKALLKWATASETNNDYFTVERSSNAIEFYAVGTLEGAGSSKTTLHYSFYDDAPLSGLNYYRLKQTDYDGKTSYSAIEAISFSATSALRVYPNPAANELSITVPGDETEFEIRDIRGLLILKGRYRGAGNASIDISELAAGTYILRSAGTNSSSQALFIKR